MEFKVNTKEELDQLSKEDLVQLSIHLQEQLVSTWESLLANNHKKFKSTSEHIHPDQLSLFNEAEVTVDTATEEEMEEAEPTTTKKSKKGKKHNLDFSGLPEKVIHHNLESPICEICGSKMQELKPTVTRVLKYVPAKCYVEKHIVHNYVCNACSKDTDSLVSKSAPEPDVTRIFDKSIASAEIVADFIYKKYMMGTPLYRIEKDLKARGLIISRQIISNWVIKAAEMYFKYIFKAMHEDARNLTYRHMDETTLVVIEDKKKDNRSKSYEWVLVSGRSEEKQMALYFYNLTRQYKFVDEILGEDAKGYVHSDGYGAYQDCTFVNVGCLAHVRRYFYEAYTANSAYHAYNKAKTLEERIKILEEKESLNINLKCLAMLNRLFDFDQEKVNRAEMKKESALVMDQFFEFLKQIQPKFLASSKLGKAISYALNAEEYVRNYLLDPELEISNNRGERMIKDFFIGRKNFLFSNTRRGAHSSSILYSVCESAKLNNLNVYEYLVYVMNTIAKQGLYDATIQSLLPYSKELPEYLRIKKSN